MRVEFPARVLGPLRIFPFGRRGEHIRLLMKTNTSVYRSLSTSCELKSGQRSAWDKLSRQLPAAHRALDVRKPHSHLLVLPFQCGLLLQDLVGPMFEGDRCVATVPTVRMYLVVAGTPPYWHHIRHGT